MPIGRLEADGFDWDDLQPEDFENLFGEPQEMFENYLEGLTDDEDELAALDQQPVDPLKTASLGQTHTAISSGNRGGLTAPHWSYDDTGFHCYVFLRGGKAAVNNAVSILSKGGLESDKFGKATRRAADGEMYDWYIRVYQRKGNKLLRPSPALIKQLLGVDRTEPLPLVSSPEAESSPTEPSKDSVRALVKESGRLHAENSVLRSRLESANSKARKLDVERERIETHYEKILVDRNLRVCQLASQLAEAHEQAGSDSDNATRLADTQRQLDNYMATFDAENRELREKNKLERDNRDQVELNLLEREDRVNELQLLLDQYDGSRPDPAPRTGAPPPARLVYQDVLKTVFPRITFIGRSVEIMSNEGNWGGAVSILQELSVNPGAVKGKKVENTRGFVERYFQVPGRRDYGRIYFRPKKGAVEVLLSDKGDQKRDFRFLKRLGG